MRRDGILACTAGIRDGMWVEERSVSRMMTPKSPLRVVSPPKAGDAHSLPTAPEPLAPDAATGLAQAQTLARQYLPQCVELWAAVAFASASSARPHTKLVASVNVKQVALAGLEVRSGADNGSDGEGAIGGDAA
jgi:hypothetical protein